MVIRNLKKSGRSIDDLRREVTSAVYFADSLRIEVDLGSLPFYQSGRADNSNGFVVA